MQSINQSTSTSISIHQGGDVVDASQLHTVARPAKIIAVGEHPRLSKHHRNTRILLAHPILRIQK
jgi:hypothetical protein